MTRKYFKPEPTFHYDTNNGNPNVEILTNFYCIKTLFFDGDILLTSTFLGKTGC